MAPSAPPPAPAPQIVYVQAPQQKVVVNVGPKPKNNTGCGCLIILLIGVGIWVCSGLSGRDHTSPSPNTSPAPGPVKKQPPEQDAEYERSVPAAQRERDRHWWFTRESAIAAGKTAEDAEVEATTLFGKPSRSWPDGYFGRSQPPIDTAAKDARYEKLVGPLQVERDRRWYKRFKSLIANGTKADDAGAIATREIGQPSDAWPPGYFERHP